MVKLVKKMFYQKKEPSIIIQFFTSISITNLSIPMLSIEITLKTKLHYTIFFRKSLEVTKH